MVLIWLTLWLNENTEFVVEDESDYVGEFCWRVCIWA